MVTPLMYDLNVLLKTSENENCIDSVIRLNLSENCEFNYNQRSDGGNILKIKTLFVCKSDRKYDDDDDNEANANDFVNDSSILLLVKLMNEYAQNTKFELSIAWTDPSTSQSIVNPKSICLQKTTIDDEFEEKEEAVMLAQTTTKNKIDYFDNGSIRKAVLVSRYVQILRQWILKNNKRKKSKSKQNNSEQQQLNVFVSEEFEDKFQSFASYFKREAMLIADDKTLNKEISVLRSLYNNK
jgi:hypothetical protein